LVLKEYRRKGIAKTLSINAINSIQKDHSIKNLFVWPFAKEGQQLAEKIAAATKLPLLIK